MCPQSDVVARNGDWHHALMYDSGAGFVDAAAPYLEDGVRRGAKVLAVVSADNVALLKGSVRSRSAVEFIDAERWYTTPARTLRAYADYATEHGQDGRPVWILGEPVWEGHPPASRTRWHRYESLINLAFKDRNVKVVCPYDTQALDGEITELARRTHPGVLEDGTASASDTFREPADFVAACDAEPHPPRPHTLLAERSFFEHDLVAVRRLVMHQAARLDLPTNRLADFVVAVNEIVTNAVRHGGGGGRIGLWVEDHHLVAEIDDRGTIGPQPLAGHLPPSDPVAAEGGFGLWMARNLCHPVEIRPGPGWVVRLAIALAPAGSRRN